MVARWMTVVIAAVLVLGAALRPASGAPVEPSGQAAMLAETIADADDACPEVFVPPPPTVLGRPPAHTIAAASAVPAGGRRHSDLVFRPPRAFTSR